jgi:hypothetical protein
MKRTRACKQFDDLDGKRLQKLKKNKDFNKTQKRKYYKMLKNVFYLKKIETVFNKWIKQSREKK